MLYENGIVLYGDETAVYLVDCHACSPLTQHFHNPYEQQFFSSSIKTSLL